MNPREAEPLWRTVVGETEPWRRGRLFLVLLAILTLVLQCLSFWGLVLAGDIQRMLGLGIYALLFWFQFYFIWIGVHWVRWLNGGWSALWGFALLIWGIRDGSSMALGVGLYSLVAGCYLGFAPSVYFFAKRQRESVRWMESLVIAAVFLLLLGSLASGVLGLLGYKMQMEREARQFADTAFTRIFAEHDPYFLFDNSSDSLLKADGGRERGTRFMQDAHMRAGDVHDIKPAVGSLRFRFSFPSHLGGEGEMIGEGVGDRNRIRMHMRVVDRGSAWKIDAVWWTFLGPIPEPAPQP